MPRKASVSQSRALRLFLSSLSPLSHSSLHPRPGPPLLRRPAHRVLCVHTGAGKAEPDWRRCVYRDRATSDACTSENESDAQNTPGMRSGLHACSQRQYSHPSSSTLHTSSAASQHPLRLYLLRKLCARPPRPSSSQRHLQRLHEQPLHVIVPPLVVEPEHLPRHALLPLSLRLHHGEGACSPAADSP